MKREGEEVEDMWKVILILGMSLIAIIAVLLMKKIAPYDIVYPIWALFVVVLFAINIIFNG